MWSFTTTTPKHLHILITNKSIFTEGIIFLSRVDTPIY